ncbi:hypothetical protein CN925_09600 [Bacillus sp. AFS055030]|nr:hypothetical protein CN925_09600 [Bacillus sp. AFS055030]
MGIVPSLKLVEEKHDKSFIFTLKNQNEHPEKLVFSSTIEYDFKIIDHFGKVLRQRSKDEVSTQKLKSVTLKQAQELVYYEDYYKLVDGLPKGTYKIEFMSTATSRNIKAVLEIEIK